MSKDKTLKTPSREKACEDLFNCSEPARNRKMNEFRSKPSLGRLTNRGNGCGISRTSAV